MGDIESLFFSCIVLRDTVVLIRLALLARQNDDPTLGGGTMVCNMVDVPNLREI